MSAHADKPGLPSYVHDNRIFDVVTEAAQPIQHASAPSTAIATSDASQPPRTALIVLNNTLDALFPLLHHLSPVHVYADGGCNRVYDAYNASGDAAYLPTVIVGDLDSIRDDVRQYYTTTHSIPVLQDKDQYATDFHKSLQYLRMTYGAEACSQMTVLVHNGIGGRFDQQMGCVHTLHTYEQYFNRLVLVSTGNLVEVLRPGNHTIQLSDRFEPAKVTHCGLFTLHGTIKNVTTTGLTWDVQNETMGWQQGEMMSYCNLIGDGVDTDGSGRTVIIECHDPIVWTTEFGGNQ